MFYINSLIPFNLIYVKDKFIETKAVVKSGDLTWMKKTVDGE